MATKFFSLVYFLLVFCIYNSGVYSQSLKKSLVSNVPYDINYVQKINSFIIDHNIIQATNDLDSIYYWVYNDSTPGLLHKDIYNYGSDSLIIDDYLWWLGSWVNDDKETFVYDSSGNVISILNQGFTSGNWININFSNYFYDIHNNFDSLIYQQWQMGAFVNYAAVKYSYDINNNPIERTEYLWDDTVWTYRYRTFYTYTILNDLQSRKLLVWSNNTNLWYNNDSTEYFYDTNNDNDSLIEYRWRVGAWDPALYIKKLYDPNHNMIFSDSYTKDSVIWIHSEQRTYSYDGANNMLSDFFRRYDDDDNTWQNVQLYNFTYDSLNRKVSHLLSGWYSTPILQKSDSLHYYYSSINNIAHINSLNHILISPVPFNNILYVRGTKSSGIITIYDVLGRGITAFAKDDYTIIETDKLKPGMYVVNYSEKNHSRIIKVLKY
jgi:hypothetical protein